MSKKIRSICNLDLPDVNLGCDASLARPRTGSILFFDTVPPLEFLNTNKSVLYSELALLRKDGNYYTISLKQLKLKARRLR